MIIRRKHAVVDFTMIGNWPDFPRIASFPHGQASGKRQPLAHRESVPLIPLFTGITA